MEEAWSLLIFLSKSDENGLYGDTEPEIPEDSSATLIEDELQGKITICDVFSRACSAIAAGNSSWLTTERDVDTRNLLSLPKVLKIDKIGSLRTRASAACDLRTAEVLPVSSMRRRALIEMVWEREAMDTSPGREVSMSEILFSVTETNDSLSK